jgi:hypothetical protein
MNIHDHFNGLKPLDTSVLHLSNNAINLPCRISGQYDSDTSSISSCESISDFDYQLWWEILDGELEASLQRYKSFLREQLHKRYPSKQVGPRNLNLSVTPKGWFPCLLYYINVLTGFLVEREIVGTSPVPEKEYHGSTSDGVVIVERTGKSCESVALEYCFWSMNGQTCQCGKC